MVGVTDARMASSSTVRVGRRESLRHQTDVVGHVLLVVHLSLLLLLPLAGGVVVAEDETNRLSVAAVKLQDCPHWKIDDE